jgi:RNA polymerase sigma factor (sigma-70 family)
MTQQPADLELLERWSQGDQHAGAELVQRHSFALYSFLRCRVPRDLEDIAQQTLLACIEQRTGWRGEASFRTYLLSIARYQVYARYRAVKRARRLAEAQVLDRPAYASEHNPFTLDEQHLSSALARLPLIFREVLRLAFYEELDSFQIAERLGIPAPTVRSRQRRALIHLRKAIGAVDHSVCAAAR